VHFVKCFADEHIHLGMKVISRAEGYHAVIKKCINLCNVDLLTVQQRMHLMLEEFPRTWSTKYQDMLCRKHYNNCKSKVRSHVLAQHSTEPLDCHVGMKFINICFQISQVALLSTARQEVLASQLENIGRESFLQMQEPDVS
jgi:hypothetical protein